MRTLMMKPAYFVGVAAILGLAAWDITLMLGIILT